MLKGHLQARNSHELLATGGPIAHLVSSILRHLGTDGVGPQIEPTDAV